MWVELYVLLEDGNGFGEGGCPTVEHLLEAIAEGEAIECLFVALSSLLGAEAIFIGHEIIGCVTGSVVSWYKGTNSTYCPFV